MQRSLYIRSALSLGIITFKYILYGPILCRVHIHLYRYLWSSAAIVFLILIFLIIFVIHTKGFAIDIDNYQIKDNQYL